MEENILDLNQIYTLDQTTRNGYNDQSVDTEIFVDTQQDPFAEVIAIQAAKEKEAKAPIVDTTDYNTENAHLIIETRPLLKLLSHITPILGTSSQRAVSRGITLIVKDTNSIDVVSPNEIFYYRATIKGTVTLPVKSHIFLEYSFLQKIAKFIPQKTLIYKKEENGMPKYYIRLTTGDLELVNTQLIEADLKRLEPEFDVLETIKELEPAPLLAALNTLSKVINFESDSKRREIGIKNGEATFRSPLVFARAKTDLIDMSLKSQVINYMIRTIQLLKDGEKLKINKTNSTQYTRYAIVTDNSYMITNYADAQEDVKVNEMLSAMPALTELNYNELRYQLDYANSITYALGTIQFTVKDGKLEGQIKLNNGSASPIDIPTMSAVNIPEGTTFKVNTKTFLSSINSLDPSLITSIGFKDGFLYLVNSDITLILLTI